MFRIQLQLSQKLPDIWTALYQSNCLSCQGTKQKIKPNLDATVDDDTSKKALLNQPIRHLNW